MANHHNFSTIPTWRHVRYFGAIVRSPAEVRGAFDKQKMLKPWWSLILWLHGNPTNHVYIVHERTACIADGFRFYGWLYRTLAVLLGSMGILGWSNEFLSHSTIFLLLLGSTYLWVSAGLAFSGANDFCNTNGAHIWQLVAFLYFVTVFLTITLTLISTQISRHQWLPDIANALLTVSFLAFGVGSYLIELAALVFLKPRETP